MDYIKVELHDLKINVGYKDQIADELYYLDNRINNFVIHKTDHYLADIDFIMNSKTDENDFRKQIRQFLSARYRGINETVISPLWESPYCCEHFFPATELLCQQGYIHKQSDGQYAVGGLFLDLMNDIDSKIRKMMIDSFNAVEYRYPTMVPSSVLEKCGCFNNFPQLVFVLTHLHHNMKELEKFKTSYHDGRLPHNFLHDYCDGYENCLPPTICYHVYQQFKDRIIPEDQSIVITTQGKAFRNEATNAETLERLCDFTIRETVFIGSAKFAIQSREKLIGLVKSFLEFLQLDGYIVKANDPFFLSQDSEIKAAFQRELESKYEIHVRTGENKSISVGSLNIHLDFFGRNFNIKSSNDDFIHTSCSGFGLERFAYAFLCQHGTDPSRWPKQP